MSLSEKLAFAQRLLRAQAEMEKTAILGAMGTFAKGVGGIAANVGKAGAWAGKKALFNRKGEFSPMRALGVGMAGLGIASELKAGKEKARAYRVGFDPNVQSFQSTPQG